MKNFIIVIAVALLSLNSCKPKSSDSAIDKKEEVSIQMDTAISPEIPTVNIQPNQKITSPLELKVNSEGVWLANEGELGWVQLVDESGNELTKGFLTSEGDWMQSGPVMFSSVLTFDSKNLEKGILIIHNNPGGGDGDEAGEELKFEIPVTF